MKNVIRCSQHPEEVYSNYCCSLNCLTPLCPDCIDDHNKRHNRKGELPEIDTLTRTKEMCRSRMTCLSIELNNLLGRLNAAVNLNFEDLIQKSIGDLDKQRLRMIDQLNRFFTDLRDEFVSKVRRVNQGNTDLHPLKEKLKAVLEEVDSIKYNVDTNKVFEAVHHSIKIDPEKVRSTYAKLVNDALSACVSLPIHIIFHDMDLGLFMQDLRKTVSFEGREVKLVMKEMPNENRVPLDEVMYKNQENWFAHKIRPSSTI